MTKEQREFLLNRKQEIKPSLANDNRIMYLLEVGLNEASSISVELEVEDKIFNESISNDICDLLEKLTENKGKRGDILSN